MGTDVDMAEPCMPASGTGHVASVATSKSLNEDAYTLLADGGHASPRQACCTPTHLYSQLHEEANTYVES